MADTIDTILSMQEQFPTSVSNAARKFVRRALHKQAKIRPAVQQLMMDPFLTHPPVQPACDDRTLLKLVLPERYSRNLSCSMLKEKGSFPSSPSPPTDFQKYYSGPPCTYKKPLGCPLGLVTPPVDMSSLSTEAATVCPKPALHFMDTQNSTCRRPAAFSVQSVLQTSGNCYSDAFQDRNNRGELHETIETCSAADVPLQEQAPSHSAHNQSLLTSARSSPDLSISARETQEKAGSMHVRHGRSEESDTSTSGLSSACNSSEKLVLHSKQPSQTDYDDMLPIYEFDEDDPQMKESSDNGWDSFSSSMSQARKPLFSVCADLRSMAT